MQYVCIRVCTLPGRITVSNSLGFRFRPQIIPNSDTCSCCRFIFYNFILKRCIMVIPQFLHTEISQKYKILIIKELEEHVSSLMNVLVSHENTKKKMHFVECWNNIWTLQESKSTTQSKVKWSEVSQSTPTLCDPMHCSLPGSSIHGIFQAIVLEWIAISFSGIFPTQGSNPSLPHCRQTLNRLSHQRSFNQSKVNALFLCIMRCTEDTYFDGDFLIGRNSVWPAFSLVRSTRGLPGVPELELRSGRA